MSGRRLIALPALAGVAALAAALVSGGSDGYVVRAAFADVGGLREGSMVEVDGVPVGTVERIRLARGDRALVEARIEDGAGPIGAGATAKVRAANLLGEKYLDLAAGDVRRPEPSGALIPLRRTGVAVELDDVLGALDLPTRTALQVVLDESGTAMTGRGRDLGALLEALPTALDRTGTLLAQLAAGNRALGRLVEESDRVVGAVAGERSSLGRLVSGSASTLTTLASRRRALGETVRQAPGTLAAARRALLALDGAAAPLGPAARGLRATAPALTATLNRLDPFMRASRPTLVTLRAVAPTLEQLGRRGTPLARRLRPLAGELRSFAAQTGPVTAALDQGIADVLGVLEGWARATAAHDGASHVFRAGLTVGSDLFELLLTPDRKRARRPKPGANRPPDTRPQPRAPRIPGLPPVKAPSLKLPDVRPPVPPTVQAPAAQDVTQLLDYLLTP